MINLKLGYSENIAREENAHYKKMVGSLINDGKLDDKLNLFLDTNDMVNIMTLSMLKMIEHCAPKFVYWPNFPKAVDGISNLFISLPAEIKEQVILSYGLEIIINTGLDDIPVFYDVMVEMNKKFLANGSVHTTAKHKNVES